MSIALDGGKAKSKFKLKCSNEPVAQKKREEPKLLPFPRYKTYFLVRVVLALGRGTRQPRSIQDDG
jgi:hypothetical protein